MGRDSGYFCSFKRNALLGERSFPKRGYTNPASKGILDKTEEDKIKNEFAKETVFRIYDIVDGDDFLFFCAACGDFV